MSELKTIKEGLNDALTDAVVQGKGEKTIKRLIGDGADIHAKSPRGFGNLHLANNAFTTAQVVAAQVQEGHLDIDQRTVDGDTPLHLAASAGDFHRSAILVALGADVNATNDNGNTPLHEAIKTFDSRTVRVLLDGGATVDAPDRDGTTPLSYAVLFDGEREEKRSCVEQLVRAGANPDYKDNNGISPREICVAKADFAILDVVNKADLRRGLETRARHGESVEL